MPKSDWRTIRGRQLGSAQLHRDFVFACETKDALRPNVRVGILFSVVSAEFEMARPRTERNTLPKGVFAAGRLKAIGDLAGAAPRHSPSAKVATFDAASNRDNTALRPCGIGCLDFGKENQRRDMRAFARNALPVLL